VQWVEDLLAINLASGSTACCCECLGIDAACLSLAAMIVKFSCARSPWQSADEIVIHPLS
jgi:hypothetical protein